MSAALQNSHHSCTGNTKVFHSVAGVFGTALWGASVLLAASFAALLMSGCASLFDALGGAFDHEPHELMEQAEAETIELVERAFSDLDAERFADVHVHMISDHINPSWRSWFYPLRRMRTEIFRSASGLPSEAWDGDQKEPYIERLLDQVEHFPTPPVIFLYAMDRTHDRDGVADPEETPMYVPNKAVVHYARQHPDVIVPVISVHPARDDAIDRLHDWADQGVRFIKWLPNSMAIDPSDKAHLPFYNAMRERGMVLLTHTGHEHAVEAVDQDLGNPLLLRTPLDAGVTVVALHAGSDGSYADFDDTERTVRPAFDLFLRLMDEEQYIGQLFGEISAVTFSNHLDRPLRELLERDDLHARLLNGSDYPVCAANIVIRTSLLQRYGFLTVDARRQLDEVYRYNPLLFDFLVKRTVRHPGTAARFSPEVFHIPEQLLPAATEFRDLHERETDN